MAVDTNTTVGQRVISAFFDTSGAAKQAIDDLEAAGIPRQHIKETGGRTAEAADSIEGDHRGFWESLKDFFLPDEDRHSYAEGIRRGGHLVTVQTEEGNYTRVLNILDTDGAVNMDEREAGWRAEGWSGFSGSRDLAYDRTTAARGSPSSGTLGGGTTPTLNRADNANLGGTAYGSSDLSVSSTDATPDSSWRTDDAARQAAVNGTSPTMRRDTGIGRDRLRGYVFDPESDAFAGMDRVSPRIDPSRITEHMDVISADGQNIGKVDHLDGPDRIKLARTSSPDGQHHYVPFTWIDHVDQHVHLTKTLAEIKAGL